MTDIQDNPETPTPIRVGRLNTLVKVRRELARLYADLRNERVTPKVAGTGAYILNAITKVLEVEVIEQRLEALEERAAGFASTSTQRADYARH